MAPPSHRAFSALGSLPRALTALLTLSLVGCQHGGRLMVVVESEGPVFEVEVEAMGRTMASHTFLADAGPDSDPGAPRLPVTPLSFVIVPTDPSNAVDVTVRGYPCDRRTTACQRIERRERARVTPNETRVLRILLSDRCAGVTCAVGVDACTESTCTCGPNGCENVPTWLDLPVIPIGGSEFEVGRPDGGVTGELDAPRPDTPELDAPEEPDTRIEDAPEEPDAPEDTPVELDGGVDAPLDAGMDAPDAPPPTCDELFRLSWGGGYSCGETACGRLGGACCEFYTTNRCIDACDAVAGPGQVDDVWSRSGGSGSCAHGSLQSATDSNVICRCGRP